MAKASAKKKSVVKKAIAKKKAVKPVKASTSKVLAFSYVKKAHTSLSRAIAQQAAQEKKVVSARKLVAEARKKLVHKRTAAGIQALSSARIAVGKATEALIKAKSTVKLANLKFVEAKARATLQIVEQEASEQLLRTRDELAARAEADLDKAQDAFIKAWSRKRAASDAKKLKKQARLLATKVAKSADKAKAKVSAAARKAEGKVVRKRRAKATK